MEAMNVSNLLSYDPPPPIQPQAGTESTHHEHQQRAHQYPTRQSVSTLLPAVGNGALPSSNDIHGGGQQKHSSSHEPTASPVPKNVAFELLFDHPNTRARLPMRVQIFPHDTTDSIVTTVKNFYGLYDGAATGVSFEDDKGNTLIARYENFKNDMIVYVRVISDYSPTSFHPGQMAWNSASPISSSRVPHLDEAFQMPPPQHPQYSGHDQPVSRPGSRVARKRSASPRPSRNRRSASAQKMRSHSGAKSRDTSLPRTVEELNNDTMNGYSDSDCGAGSVTSSFKARSEQLASAEISVDNIVEGGRRKRAKFESSELPLFVPPQVPATNSISSISPQRRSNGQENLSPFARPLQRAFTYPQSLQSPQSFGNGEHQYGIVATNNNYPYATQSSTSHGHRLRDRTNVTRLSSQASTGAGCRTQAFGILPTPDPTVASCISDEDVALQLMRLGEHNFSHGRTSASTLDDAFSGRADVASSATSEDGDDSENTEHPYQPLPRVQPKMECSPSAPANYTKRHSKHINDSLRSFDSTEQSGGEADGDYQYDNRKDGFFKSDPDDMATEFGQTITGKLAGSKFGHNMMNKSRNSESSKKNVKVAKPRTGSMNKKPKISSIGSGTKVPPSTTSTPDQPRKISSASTLNFQHHLGADEEDLSSKPRCQRCRKSKKGCDRQRPCQRCKDAGIGPEGCVSEDEGNGRKGRFGRHMGVSVKKDHSTAADSEAASAISAAMVATTEKSKKRKR